MTGRRPPGCVSPRPGKACQLVVRAAILLAALAAVLALGCAGSREGLSGPDAFVALSREQLDQAREQVRSGGLGKAAEALREDCAQALEISPPSVVRPGKTGPSPDPHDYVSLAYYLWPNPDTPDGHPWILRDGEPYPPAAEAPDRLALEAVCKNASALALGYRLTGDEALATHAAAMIRVFFVSPQTRMNPHLEYGQMRTGEDTGGPTGIIDTCMLPLLADVPALLGGSPAFTVRDREGFRSWMSAYLDWLLTSAHGRLEARRGNNHGTWYDVQVVALALACGRAGDAVWRLEQAPARLDAQFDGQGLQPEEARRTKSLGYHLFNLEAWFTLALMAEKTGLDLWNLRTPSGASLRKGLDALLPYLTGGKPWPYRQMTELTPRNFRQAAFLLRLAALKWNEPAYEADMAALLGRKGSRLRVNLLFMCPS